MSEHWIILPVTERIFPKWTYSKLPFNKYLSSTFYIPNTMKGAKKKKKKKTENKCDSYSHGVYSLVGETVLNQVITQITL